MLKDKVYTENPHTEDVKESVLDVEFQIPNHDILWLWYDVYTMMLPKRITLEVYNTTR